MENIGEFFEKMLDMGGETSVKILDEFKTFLKVFLALIGPMTAFLSILYTYDQYVFKYYVILTYSVAAIVSLVYMYGKKSTQEKINEIFNLKKIIKDQSLTIIDLIDKIKMLGDKPELRRIEPPDV